MNDNQIAKIITAKYQILLAISRRRNRHEDRAQEALHQVLERAWAKRHTFSGNTEGELYQWLKTIVCREIPDNPTFRKAQPKLVSIEPWHEPGDHMRAGYWSRYLHEIMQHTHSATTEFKMFALHDMTFSEIERATGTNQNTIATRVKRDRDRIFSKLA